MEFVSCGEIKGIPQGDSNCWMTAFLGMFIINDETLLWFMMNFLDPALIKTRFGGYDEETRKVIIDMQILMRKIVLDLHRGKIVSVDECHMIPSIILNRAKIILGETSVSHDGVQKRGKGANPIVVIQDMFELFKIPEVKFPYSENQYFIDSQYVLSVDMTTINSISPKNLTKFANSLANYSEDYYLLNFFRRDPQFSFPNRDARTDFVSSDVVINDITYNLKSMQIMNPKHVVSLPKCNREWYMHESNLVKAERKMVKLASYNKMPAFNGNGSYIIKNPENYNRTSDYINSIISEYNYMRDDTIFLYLKPYHLLRHKYEQRLREKYWDTSADKEISVTERKRDINKRIKELQNKVNTLIFDFELIFDPSVEYKLDKTRILAREKNSIERPDQRKKILDKLVRQRNEIKRLIKAKSIITNRDIEKIENMYFNTLKSSQFARLYNFEIFRSNVQRIGAIRKARENIKKLFTELGELKTGTTDEVEFLELLKFINDRVKSRDSLPPGNLDSLPPGNLDSLPPGRLDSLPPGRLDSLPIGTGAGNPLPGEAPSPILGGKTYNLFKKN